jgi:hypothetical protein
LRLRNATSLDRGPRPPIFVEWPSAGEVSGGFSVPRDRQLSGKPIDQDAEQLKALGYVSHFDRTMSKWENFSLGFTYLSPVVGVYTIFASAFVAGGPPMWWTTCWSAWVS